MAKKQNSLSIFIVVLLVSSNVAHYASNVVAKATSLPSPFRKRLMIC